MVGTSFSGTSIHCYDKHQQKKKYYDAIDDNNTMTSSTSTITTTATSLHSSIRDHDDDTELLSSSSSSSSSSPLMSFDFHELQHNNSDKSDDKSTHNDDNNNNNNNNNNSSSSSTSSASASSSSSSYWSLYQYVDLRYTMLSNLIFLLGSSCQTYLAIIDLRASIRRKAEMENDDYDYDYDYYYAGDDTYVYTVQDDVYYILYGLGPFLCIINACIDLRWQLEYSKISPLSSLSSCCRRCWCFFRGSERKQQESVTSSSSSITSSSTLSDDYDVSSPLHYEDSIDDSSLSTFHSTESSSSLSGEYWGYVVVSLFGLGSVLSFYSTFLDDYFEDQDKWDDDSYLIKMEKKRPWYACNYKINFIAIHLYLLSGVVDLLVQRNSMSAGGSRNKLSCDIRKLFSVCFNRSNTNNNNNTSDDAKQLLSKNNSFSSSEEVEEGVEETTTRIAKLCMFIGTFLFVSGTLLDCTIAILYDPQQRHELNPDHIVNIDKVLLGTAGLTSCLLWTIDAILYIIADFFLYSLHIEDSKARRFLSNGFKIPSSITDHTNDSDSNHHSDTATTVSTIPMQFIEEKQQHKLVDVLLSSSTTNETVPLLLSSDDEPHKYYNRV